MRKQISSDRGFSMIEVMVTIVVVAFGLLGLASLVLRGLQAGADSQFRTLAIKQTYDMADRMRGNPVDAKAGNYDGILPSGSPSCSSLLTAIKGGAFQWLRLRALPLRPAPAPGSHSIAVAGNAPT